jgi:uncharacterized membrane protein
MLPNPLHPAVVHFPIVLTVILPLFVGGAWWAIARGARPSRAWALPTALAAALLLSAFVAVRTGESEEERVEKVVSEQILHEHEEAAERFIVLSGVLLGLMTVGLLRGTVGGGARVVATAGVLVVLAAGVQVGKAGGDLVYREGAASAYVTSPDSRIIAEPTRGEEGKEHE